MKRLFDVLMSGLGLLVLSPLFFGSGRLDLKLIFRTFYTIVAE